MADAYLETLRYLWNLRRLGTRPGLEVIRALLKALDHPEHSFQAIHITGSKGKGSTSAFCASVLTAAGYRTGLYTSPHLLSYRERVVVDGKPISKREVVEGMREVRRIATHLRKAGKLSRDPTFFEVTTAMAFRHFCDVEVDVAVVEVGLGGRLDATNTLSAPLCVLTTLELEHTDVLGSTLEDIAREKAGIFHRGAWAVTGVEGGVGSDVIRRAAFSLGVPLWQAGKDFQVLRRTFDHDRQEIDVRTPMRERRGLVIPLLGAFQTRNAAVAVAALDLSEKAAGLAIPEEAFFSGLSTLHWAGRLDRLSNDPPFYVDVAHTVESVKEVVSAMKELEPLTSPRDSAAIFSCLKDKALPPIMEALSELFGTLIVAPLKNERAMSVETIERWAKKSFQRVVLAPSVKDAWTILKEAVGPKGVMLATGSTYLVSEVMARERGLPMERPVLSDGAVTHSSTAEANALSP